MTASRLKLALLPALALLGAGCGGVTLHDVISVDRVAHAAAKTNAQTSMRVAFSGAVSGPWAGEDLGFSGSGVVDGAAEAGRFHLRFNVPPAARAQLGGNPSMDMVFLSRPRLVMYMRAPMLSRQLPGARQWLRLDPLRASGVNDRDVRSLAQLKQTNPSQNLGFLQGAVRERELGYDRVRGGTLTTHYALSIDLRRAAKDDPAERRALAQLRRLVGRRLPVEAWIDERGYLRKLAFSFSVARSPDGPIRFRLSEEFYGFGVRAHVQAPPAAGVSDATSLLGRA